MEKDSNIYIPSDVRNPKPCCSFESSGDISSQNSFDTAVEYPKGEMGKSLRKASVNSNSIDDSSSNHMEINNLSDMPAILTPQFEMELRRKIRYHFMNPLEKWKIKRKYPWKLSLQIIKIILVTVQLVYFGYHSYKYVKEHNDATSTLRHIFLLNWDSTRDVVAYPPSSGPYAVYTKQEFYKNINHVVKKYAHMTDMAIGSFGYDSQNGSMGSLQFCKIFFRKGKLVIYNETITFDNTPVEKCIEIPPLYPPNDHRWNNFSIRQFLQEVNDTVNFDRLISAELKFSIKVVFVKSLSKLESPDCYRLNISVLYDNVQHDGQIIVSLCTKSDKLSCHAKVDYSDDDDDDVDFIGRQVLNVLIIILCSLSAILCCRSLYKGQLLRIKVSAFFKEQYDKKLSFQDQLDFIDFWFVMIIINDILIIAGSAIKIRIEQRITEGDQYNLCSILLGLGNLLAWAGVLRYLGYFHKYNILILTLKQALPNVMRFMLCALLLYGGFCFCGWVVLGPYHIKFRYLSTTSECLFSLMNGDDMFATFAILDTNNVLIWFFSRAYLYLFICLFIYVVISLFISVIMDTYETIKEYYVHGTLPQTDFQRFIAESPENLSYCSHHQKKSCNIFSCFQRCRKNDYKNF